MYPSKIHKFFIIKKHKLSPILFIEFVPFMREKIVEFLKNRVWGFAACYAINAFTNHFKQNKIGVFQLLTF